MDLRNEIRPEHDLGATFTGHNYDNNTNNNREPLGEPAFRRRTGRRQQRGLVNINLQIQTSCRVTIFDKGNRLLEINPDLLIIVEGILSAGNLMGALIHPIELSRPEKLVYSGHIYPFSPIISDLDYPLFKSLMHTMQVDIIDTKNTMSLDFGHVHGKICLKVNFGHPSYSHGELQVIPCLGSYSNVMRDLFETC